MSEYIPTINNAPVPQMDWKGAIQAGQDQRKADAEYLEQMRAQNSRNQLQAAVQKSTSVDPTTGRTVVDWQGAAAQAVANGADPTHVQGFLQERANLTSTEAENKKKQDAQRDGILTDSVNQLRGAQDSDVFGLLKGSVERLAQVYMAQGMKQQDAVAQAQKDLGQRFGIDPETHGPMSDAEKIAHIKQAAARLEASAVTSSQQAIQNQPTLDANKRANATLDAEFKAKLATTDGMNPNSALSKSVRDAAIQAGVPASAVANMSALQIQTQYADQVRSLAGNSQITPGIAVEAVRNATVYGNKADTLDVGIKAARSMKPEEFGKFGTLVGAKLDEWINQDPKRAQAKAAIDAYNNAHPTNPIDIAKMRPEQWIPLLEQEGKVTRASQRTEQKIAKAPTRQSLEQPDAAKPKQPTSQPKVQARVFLQAPDGRVGSFDPVADKDKIAKYVKLGAKQVKGAQ